MTPVNKTDNTVTFSDGHKFDISLLDNLKNQKVSGSIWSQYNTTAKGGNNNDIFDEAEIENIKKDLLQASKQGRLDENTLNKIYANQKDFNVFAMEQKMEALKLDATFANNMFEKNDVAARDATYVAQKPFIEQVKINRNKPDYAVEFENYAPTNYAKYTKVLKHVSKRMSKDKAVDITNMVCSLSDKYGMDPEITVAILEKETGGYNFSGKVMQNRKSQYKGVMQVDYTSIECMYADSDDAKNPKLLAKRSNPQIKHRLAVAGDHRHYSYDQTRIDQLKKLYPTPQALYKAIQSDVSLGLEVGIMAYKGKMSRCGGNTRAALKAYCGNSYRLPADSTAVSRIYPIPNYSDD